MLISLVNLSQGKGYTDTVEISRQTAIIRGLNSTLL